MNESSHESRWKVAVYPSGNENGLEAIESLRFSKHIELFGYATGTEHHGPLSVHRYRSIPSVFDDDWLTCLREAIIEDQIELVIPCHDHIIDALVRTRDEIPCQIALPPSESVRVARSKSRLYGALGDTNLVPPYWTKPNLISAFPVVAKPDDGYGGQGVLLCPSLDEAERIPAANGALVFQEFLPGNEVTVDCFSSVRDGLLLAHARLRERIRMGTAVRTRTAPPEVQSVAWSAAQTISEKLDIRGVWFFQLRQDAGGDWKIMDLGVRIAGSMGLTRLQGANAPLMSVWDTFHPERHISVLQSRHPEYVERHLGISAPALRGFSSAYVDLDDTLIVHGHLNDRLVRVLAQLRNEQVSVHLLTKSRDPDLTGTLHRLGVLGLFDSVIQINETDSKSEYIHELNSIVIDDSFSQRQEIHERLGIATFAPDMIDALFDPRAI